MTKVLVISPKGGCGKSTFAFQFLAPYFYNRDNQKSLLIDLDNANNESNSFTASEIIESKECNINEIDMRIALEKRNVIIDSGATSLAQKTLRQFIDTNLIDYIDYFAIPLSKGKQATSSALDIYTEIKKYKTDAKVFFVLSETDNIHKYPLEMQFLNFLGDKIHCCYDDLEEGEYDKIKKQDPSVNYISIPYDPCLPWVSNFGITAYEFADKKEMLKERQKTLVREAMTDPTKCPALDLTTYKLMLVAKCVEFKNELLEKTFNNLDQIIQE